MTTRKEALQELLAKVEAESIGDTGVDRFDAIPSRGGGVYADPNWYDAGSAYWRGDLNAAKALHEAVLPEWRYNLGWTTGDERAFASVWPCSDMWGWIDANSDTPARAWLIAIIKALIAQEARG